MSLRFIDNQDTKLFSVLESLMFWLRGSAATEVGFSEADEQASVRKRFGTEESFFRVRKWVQIDMRGRVMVSMQENYREQRKAMVE